MVFNVILFFKIIIRLKLNNKVIIFYQKQYFPRYVSILVWQIEKKYLKLILKIDEIYILYFKLIKWRYFDKF